MVSISCAHTVVPCKSTPKGRLWCSDIDQIVARTHVPSLYVYRPESELQFPKMMERMKESLAQVLVHFYPVAGRIRITERGRLEVECNEMGVTLFEAESEKTLAQYGDFKPDESIKELVPIVDYSKLSIEEAPLLFVQVTRTSCNGVCVGISLSHVITDGSAFTLFMNSWAKLARGDKLSHDDMPYLDRTILKSPDPIPELVPRFDHPECKPFPLILGSSDFKEEQEKETSVALLKITREQVEKLKQKANDDVSVTMNQEAVFHRRHIPYSRYEAMATHIWRSASKARKNDQHQPTRVRIVGDIRYKLDPPLPRNYFGNAILRGVTPTCLAGDIISKPLSYGAQKFREATAMFTNECYLRSQILFLTNEQNVDWKHQFAGNPNLHIVSWMSMPVYEADFGWGKPVYFGPVSIRDDGRVFIISGPPGADCFFIACRFQTAHMEAFKKYFYEDI